MKIRMTLGRAGGPPNTKSESLIKFTVTSTLFPHVVGGMVPMYVVIKETDGVVSAPQGYYPPRHTPTRFNGYCCNMYHK